MKITGIEAWTVRMPLAEPYTIAYQAVEAAENVFLRLETSSGVVGYGCSAPDPPITGESAATVVEAYGKHMADRLKGADPLRYMRILADLQKVVGRQPAALALADTALFDLVGKIARLPLYQMLGGFRTRIQTSITIGILPVDRTLELAEKHIRNGFSILKIKGGTDVDLDIERVLKVRERIGPSVRIRFDANQGYTAEQAHRFIEAARRAALESIEQPTDRYRPELLGRIRDRHDLPVMADESLLRLRDVYRLAKRHLVDIINVKLMKAGGISEALQICAAARAARLEVMVGCMDESALGISAGLHVALARQSVRYADLDGHLDLMGDPADGAVILKGGYLYPNRNPGLGVVKL
jgi:L-Ala-D/L-Glu epimerase